MAISQQQVEHIARLARLDLEPGEGERLGRQLDQILTYVEQLNQLNTEDIEPASHALPLSNVYRDDQSRHRLSHEEIVQNAPELEGEFFRVPQILSEEA